MVGHDQGRQWNHAVPSLICYHRPVNILYTDYVEESIYSVSRRVERIKSNQKFDAISKLPTCSLSARFVLLTGCVCEIFPLPLSMLNLVVFAFSLLKIEKNRKINTTIYNRLGYFRWRYGIYMD